MTTTIRFIAPVAIAALFVAAATPVDAGPVKTRQNVQDARIDQGVRAGTITKSEQAGLRGQQKAIDRARDKALANDGKMSKKEAKKLTKAQNRASGDIKAAKQNARSK